MDHAGNEALGCGQLLQELGRQIHTPIHPDTNNQGAIAADPNPEPQKRAKQIDTRSYWIRKQVEKKAAENSSPWW